MYLTCQTLLDKYEISWQRAIRHPFLSSCKDASIKPDQFNTWLTQDYLFVIEFTRMQARTLANAPVSHYNTLLTGLGSMKAELDWFKEKAVDRQLDLQTPMQTANQQYCDFLAAQAKLPYAVQITVMWSIKLAYNQAWQIPGIMAKPYDEFANRWGNMESTHYVFLLEEHADAVLRDLDDKMQKKVISAFLKVAEYEHLFWEMAYRINYKI